MPRHPDPKETAARRSMIKKLFLLDHITSRAELHRRVNNAGFVCTPQTIYKDMKVIANLSDVDVAEFNLDLIAIYRRMIRSLELMIEGCKSVRDRASLMRTLSMLMKDMGTVTNSLAVRSGGTVRNPKKVEKENVVISFLEKEHKKGKGGIV